jgi:MFS family permease
MPGRKVDPVAVEEDSALSPRISKTVWQIGLMMMLMNISYIIVYSFLGLYLTKVMSVSVLGIGFIEGVCESISNSMKLVSGMLSDFFRRRKRIIVVGLLLSVFSRPILFFADSFVLVFSSKALDRFGNGIQASPRDAIVADVSSRKKIGASYGLKRSLAYSGSMIGAIIGIIAMSSFDNNYKAVFGIAVIPAVVALFILLFFVKEPQKFNHQAISSEAPAPTPKLQSKFAWKNFQYLGKAFWFLMIVNSVFMMARMNETFLILYAHTNFAVIEKYVPIIMIIYNSGMIISSYPVGLLGDRFSRMKILMFGIFLLILADFTMFIAPNLGIMLVGVLFWGLQGGSTQNVFVSLVAEKVPEDLRGTGFGVYWIINAFSSFIAESIAGYISHHFSLAHAFLTSGVIALLSLFSLVIIFQPISKKKEKIRR